MKKLLLLCACLLALASPLRAQTAPPADIVVVRIQDYRTSAVLFITRGEGKTERVAIDSKGLSLDKNMTAVSEGYFKVIENLYREGYALQNSSSISFQGDGGVTTYLFIKNH
ncbi:hypothetical protein GKZ68_12090 [Hymenobacter sp. BRD128]|uniref:hypothetical protein n=1 Tax=Hymenobacter sp. BRD128 TaxID=2675878 RepID=UPI0015657501|nr:hypothetical protein [Hymenobacter sp. BRD128]QKG57294.1 hypothetical protein GKZ68_12090 [Hymenobacter sp. BRD128]